MSADCDTFGAVARCMKPKQKDAFPTNKAEKQCFMVKNYGSGLPRRYNLRVESDEPLPMCSSQVGFTKRFLHSSFGEWTIKLI